MTIRNCSQPSHLEQFMQHKTRLGGNPAKQTAGVGTAIEKPIDAKCCTRRIPGVLFSNLPEKVVFAARFPRRTYDRSESISCEQAGSL